MRNPDQHEAILEAEFCTLKNHQKVVPAYLMMNLWRKFWIVWIPISD